MRNLVVTTAFVLALGSTAMAQAQTQTTSMYQGQMEKLDSNSNGSVERGEYEAFMNVAFDSLDKNKDGSLRVQEMSLVLTPQQFAATDKDSNGRVSRNEFLQRVMADFATADKSGDGNLQ